MNTMEKPEIVADAVFHMLCEDTKNFYGNQLKMNIIKK